MKWTEIKVTVQIGDLAYIKDYNIRGDVTARSLDRVMARVVESVVEARK